MKHTLLFFLAFCMVMLAGCKDNDKDTPAGSYSIEVTPDFKVIKSGSFDVTVKATGPWTAVADKSWVSLSKDNGKGIEFISIAVSEGEEEDAMVEFTCGAAKDTLTINRIKDIEPGPHGEITYLSFGFDYRHFKGAHSGSYTIHSSSSWDAYIDRQWLKLSRTSGPAGDTKVTLSFENGEDDQAKITLRNATHTRVITVVREYDEVAGAPEGAIWSKFTVSATGRKVYFSKGALQYNAASGSHKCADGTTKSGTWRFADTQYQVIGSANKNISTTYNGWIDLFGWGTSGYNGILPTFTYGPEKSNKYAGGGETSISDTNYDWGQYNAISNGGNQPNTWRTLTSNEWQYLINSRPNAARLYGIAFVNTNKALIILPDNYLDNPATGVTFNAKATSWTANELTLTQFNRLAEKGAVLIPMCGWRDEKTFKTNDSFQYWTSTFYDRWDGWSSSDPDRWFANTLTVRSDGTIATDIFNFLSSGLPVRLVQDVK